MQERAEAETSGHLGKGSERFPVRIRDANAFEPQIELSGLPIDAEAGPGNHDLHPAARPVHDLLKKGGQPVKVDRTSQGVSVISEGLSGDETVVIDGQLLLSDGTRVEPRTKKAGA